MIVYILLALVALLAVGEFLLFGALAECYRDMKQFRKLSGLIDFPTPVELGEALEQAPSSIDLPSDLDSAVRAVVVYVDSRCSTCRSIVGSLNGGIPAGITLVVIADSIEQAFSWLGESGIDEHSTAASQVTIMSPEDVEKRLGSVVTPLAIEIEYGRLVRAKIVPSVRQFYALVPAAKKLHPQVGEGVAK